MSEVKKIATRESYGNALVELGKEHEDLVVLDADLELGTRGVVNGYITVGCVAHVNNVIRCRCGETHREDSCCKNCASKTKKPLHIRRSPFGNWLPALSEG